MRKKFSVLMVVILCMITVGCGMKGLRVNGSAIIVGRLLVSENSYKLVDEEGEPYSLSCTGDKNAMFAGMKTGDKVKIRHDGIRESFPAQVTVLSCKKLKDGDIEDVDSSGLYALLMMNHVGREVFESENIAVYSDEDVSMSLQIPEGWSYELNEPDEGAYGYGCGISFWPSEYSEGKIYLRYFRDGFGVCGTELEKRDTMFAGREASIGIYGNNIAWDFVSFFPNEKDIAFIFEGVEDWWEDYKEEAIYIMHSMKLGNE